jgi:hypothetical protein
MALYYFDMRDDDQFYPDERGTELGGGLAAARMWRLRRWPITSKDAFPRPTAPAG